MQTVGAHRCQAQARAPFRSAPHGPLRVSCAAGTQPQPQPSRRGVLGAAVAAPLLLQLLRLPGGGGVPPAAAATGGPRLLTPEQAAAVEAAFKEVLPKSKAPVMVRLVFHDAGTYSAAAGDGGLNASIQYELERPDNFGLKRGWNVIEAAAKRLQGTPAEGVVSKADLIALAGAYAVRITGGPSIQLAVGRRDAAGPDPDGRMPEQTASAEEQVANFAAKGLSPDELIVLSGSHTLGSKGYGDPVVFDNTYFVTLLDKPWERVSKEMGDHIGIPTDHVLPDAPGLRPIIQRYANNQKRFFADFAEAYVKLAELGVKWV